MYNDTALIKKLDLDEYILAFEGFFARPKPVAMEGDTGLHHRFIKALGALDFPEPPCVVSLEDVLMRLQKEAVLGLDEIEAFVRIINYFHRLKALRFEEPLASWLRDIVIPDAMVLLTRRLTDEGEINPEYDEELFAVQEALARNKRRIKEALQALVRSSKLTPFLVDTQVHLFEGEETLLVRGGFNRVLKATVVGRSSGGFFYVIPQQIDRLKAQEAALLSEQESIIYRHRKELSKTMREHLRFLRFIDKAFDRFDHYQARVRFAKARDYQFVLPSNTKSIKLRRFVHPALTDPVPVDIDMDKSIMLITGVNAGGKTMLLKSILAAAWMSKYLLPFRCHAHTTQIGRFKHIDAIIDDPQSVKNDISTFAGRMQAFADLFARRDALIGVDEIELGTDSDEAASLFRVLLDELKGRDIRFVVTTHHKRLASLMGADEDVELIAAVYDEAKRRPTYTYLQGIVGKSYAFETALRYGIPATIVARAKKVYGEDKERLNELIERSTELERSMRQAAKEHEAELARIKKQRQKLIDQETRLRSEYEQARLDLERRYQAAIKEAQEAIRAKESQEGRRLLNKAHQAKSATPKPPRQASKALPKEGDRVKYRSHYGLLLSIRGNSATIEVDGLKMRVPYETLRIAPEESKRSSSKPRPKSTHRVERDQSAGVSIKLLGLYADEAIEKVDKFISDAMLHGFDEVQIVHGTGSGVLAKVVSEYLQHHPKIRRFYRMPENLGVTIVEL